VRLKPNEPDYLATIITWDILKRSMLCIHDSSGKLVYEEVLPEICKSIQAMPAGVATIEDKGTTESDTAESLLIGGSGRIWKFTCED